MPSVKFLTAFSLYLCNSLFSTPLKLFLKKFVEVFPTISTNKKFAPNCANFYKFQEQLYAFFLYLSIICSMSITRFIKSMYRSHAESMALSSVLGNDCATCQSYPIYSVNIAALIQLNIFAKNPKKKKLQNR